MPTSSPFGIYCEKAGRRIPCSLIGVYDRAEEIPWDDLPDRFVLKCTHGSGTNIICRDKSKLDRVQAVKDLYRWLKKNHFWGGREWFTKTSGRALFARSTWTRVTA
jgi:hypothetical protein